MESRINYTMVGLFVLLLTTGLIYFVFWLGAYGSSEEYDHYRVRMSESVAGLSADASVKYMGVGVGTVAHIGIDPENSRRVELILKIKRGTPITVDTTAQLKFFGITGLAFIELKGGIDSAPPLRSVGKKMPVIPSKPSTLKRMDESLSLLASKSARALEKIDKLLSNENIKNLSKLFVEMRLLSKDIRSAVRKFQTVMEQTSVTEEKLVKAAGKVGALSDDLQKTAAGLETVYAEVGSRMSSDVHHSLELLNQLLFKLDMLTQEMQGAARQMQESPADMLFRRTNPRPGPGEPGYKDGY